MYKITYNLAGGSVGTSNPSTYTVETDTFTLNNPTKVGYVFEGWVDEDGNTITTDTIVNENMTIPSVAHAISLEVIE